MKRTQSLRFRMMALFCAVVGIWLVGSYLIFYALLSREVRAQLDRQLLSTAKPIVADLAKDLIEDQDVADLNIPDEFFELLDGSGRVRQRSKSLKGNTLEVSGAKNSPSEAVYQDTSGKNLEPLRAVLLPFTQAGQPRILLVATSRLGPAQVLAHFRGLILIFLPVSLLFTGLISAWYVGRSLTPITELTERAAEMSEHVSEPGTGSLWKRLPVTNPEDEVGRLAETFNLLAERVDSALRQLRQFVSDASHELRTPLTILRGETELLLSEPRTPEEYRETLEVLNGELEKLSRMVQGLFTLSMADAGQLRVLREPVYLNDVLEESCVLAAQLGRNKGIRIERNLNQAVPYCGDEGFLRELFLIFLDNAVKYSPPGARVQVDLECAQEVVRARFQDHGAGILPVDRPHIFERFYRANLPANGDPQSGGLGLAIAQAIAQAHSGSIECETTPGAGSIFTVTLPLRTGA